MTAARAPRDRRIVEHARRWFVISGIIVVVSLGSLAIRKVNLGLEFSGGTALTFEARADVTVTQLRNAAAKVGEQAAVVQQVGSDGFLLQTRHLDIADQERLVAEVARIADIRPAAVNVTDVGPKWGQQITTKAIRAFLIFLAVATAYMAIRLEPKMGVAALVAMVHDLVITAGVYSLSGFAVTPATVIAILTILGYSLYDTVVIFDRVKERTSTLSAAGRMTYSDSANAALNEVLIRSLNTSVTGLLPVGSLLFVGAFLLGAETLEELALALFVGLVAGTYSSIFVATPLLAVWKEREPRWATLRARVAARGSEPARAAVPAATPEPATAAVAPASASGGSAQRASAGGPPRRKKKKRKKRR